MDNASKEKEFQDFINTARKHITTIDWDNPQIIAPIKQFTDMAFGLVEKGEHGFGPLAKKGFEPELIDGLNTVAMNSYFIEMHFWQTVAFVLEAKIRGLEAIMSGKEISDLFPKS